MLIGRIAALGAYDRVYLSPHLDDAALSCGASMLDERARGLRILVLTLFSDGPEHAARRAEDSASLDPLGIDRLHAGLRDAPWRSTVYSTFAGIVHGWDPGDDVTARRVREILAEVRERTLTAALAAPLAVGTHVDHRIVSDAAMAVAPAECDLYEELPYAFARGATALRLRQLGATWPEGALELPSREEILASFHELPYVRRHLAADEAQRCEAALLEPIDAPHPHALRATPHLLTPASPQEARLAMVAAHASQIEDMLGGMLRFARDLAVHASSLVAGAQAAERRWRLRAAP